MKLPKVRGGVGIMQFTERYWREQIAQEISSSDYDCNNYENTCCWKDIAAAIVRGEVKVIDKKRT